MNETNIFKKFTQGSKNYPEKNAILFKSEGQFKGLTYRDIYERSIRFGNILKDKQLKQNDKIAIILDNQPEYSMAFLGVMYANAISVAIDAQYSEDQIKGLLSHSEAKLLITSQKTYEKFKNRLENFDVIVIDSTDFAEKLHSYSPENRFEDIIKENDIAMLFYTSGSTSNPKAVMLSHSNLLSNFDSIYKLKLVNEDDVFISILPLHHAFSFTATFLTPLFSGAAIVYPLSLSSAELISCMNDAKVSIFVGVPQVFSLIHNSILKKMQALPSSKRKIAQAFMKISSALRKTANINLGKTFFSEIQKTFGGNVRLMISGGAKLDVNVAEDFLKWGFTILEGYGLTETSPVVTLNPENWPKIGSVGKAIPNIEIKIISPDENGLGEVAIKGPNVMLGYYKMPDATKEVIRESWFYTGDLGHLDKQGYLYLAGRKNEMIVLSSGKNIFPEDIERHYAKCPYIKEICVLSFKDSSFAGESEVLVAIIVINEEHFKSKNETRIKEKLRWEMENLSAQLPTYQRIKGFVTTRESLPRTRLGKIMRHKMKSVYEELRKALEDSNKDEDEDLNKSVFNKGLNRASAFFENKINIFKKQDQENSSEIFLQLIQQTLGRTVKINDHLELDLGLDSLQTVELLLNLKQRLNLALSEEEMMDFLKCRTINDLLETLKKNIPDNLREIIKKDKPLDWIKILREIPSVSNLSNIRINFSFWAKFVNFIIVIVFKIIFRVFYLLRVEGKNNLTSNGPYLICPNHSSYLDGLFVLAALPFDVIINTYFLGLSEVFESKFLKRFTKGARLIPIDVSVNPVEALKSCSFVLRNSKIVCYFPEGQRSIDGEVKEFKKGVGILIKELNIDVVPVYLEGSYGTWSRNQRFPKLSPVKVKFGKKLRLIDLLYKETNEDNDYEVIAENLRKEVIKLSGNMTND